MYYVVQRIIISLAALIGAVIHQTDVKPAFHNGLLNTTVYIEQPTGYEVDDCAKKVGRLKKALYGLTEAPQLWFETFNKVLVD